MEMSLPKLPSLSLNQPVVSRKTPKKKDRRRKPRFSVEELNQLGLEEIQQRAPDIAKDVDTRSSIVKVFDWLDLPRNIVAQAVAAVAGMDTSKQEKGALGLRKVYVSDVLDHLGVENRVVKAVLGFVGDVAIDPLTYLSAGSTAGLSAGKHVPKISGAGKNILSGALKSGRAGQLGKALGRNADTAIARLGEKFGEKSGTRALAKWLGKNAVRGDDVGDAAREFFRAYGQKGRPLARIPFTNVTVGRVPFGKQAAAYKSLSLGPDDIKKLAEYSTAKSIGSKSQALRSLEARAKELRAVQQQTKQIPEGLRPLEKKIKDLRRSVKGGGSRLGMSSKTTAGIGRESKMRSLQAINNPESPEILRQFLQQDIGRYIDPNSKLAPLSEAFGTGLKSPLRQKALGIAHQMGPGTRSSGDAAFAAIRPMLDDVARALEQTGRHGDAATIRHNIGQLLDIAPDAKAGMSRLVDDDAGRALFEQLRPLYNEPGVRDVMRKYRQMDEGLLARERAFGVRRASKAGHFARQPATEARKHIGRTEYAKGGPSSNFIESYRLTTEQPFAKGRTKYLEFGNEFGETRRILSTDRKALQELDKLADEGWKLKKQYDISAAEMEKLAGEGRLQKVLGDQFQKEVIQKGSPLFEMDPAMSIATRARQGERSIAAQRLTQLVKQYGVPVEPDDLGKLASTGMRVPKKLSNNHPLKLWMPPGVYPDEGLAIAYPEQVASMLDRFASAWTDVDKAHDILKAADMYMSWWKRWALFHPAYVIRNSVQNAFGTLMAGGNPIKSAKWATSKQVQGLRKALHEGQDHLLKHTIRIGDRSFDARTLAREAIEGNVLGAGKSTAEFQAPALRASGALSQTASRGGRALKKAADSVRVGNQALEESQRLGAWFNFIEQGMTPKDASQHVLLAMPDLSDVTKFERTSMARVLPWYRWMKGNGALQLFHYLPQQPGWAALPQKLKRLVEEATTGGDVVPERLRPGWMREQQAAQIMGDDTEGQSFLLRSWFPFEEANAAMVAPVDVSESTRWLTSSLRPEIKFLFESSMGRDLFRDRPFAKEGTGAMLKGLPQSIMGASGTPLDNLLAIRPLREYGRRVWEQPSAAAGATRAVIGGAVQPMSKEKGKTDIDWQLRQEMTNLRTKFVRAMENKNFPEARNLLIRWLQIQRQRKELGLPVGQTGTDMLQEVGVGT